jgi:hypothetical protein
MSTHVVGFMPADDDWNKKAAAYRACEAAGVPVPKELEAFFGDGEPGDPGREVEIEHTKAVREWNDGDRGCAGFDVEISKLPKDVKIVRFYNSW